MPDRKPKLFSLYTEGYEPLRDRFVSSIEAGFDLRLRKLSRRTADFATRGYAGIIMDKVGYIVSALRDHPGEILAYSDIDVQFFRPFAHRLESLLGDRDIVFQAERLNSPGVNTGFFLARSRPEVLAFFEAILKTDFRNRNRYPHFDQSAVNALLPRSGLRHGLLDARFYCRTHGKSLPRDIILHHATCTVAFVEGGRTLSSLELKIRQLDAVRREAEPRVP